MFDIIWYLFFIHQNITNTKTLRKFETRQQDACQKSDFTAIQFVIYRYYLLPLCVSNHESNQNVSIHIA